MKKNISINISGIIFHIEEDGYEKLRKYLNSIAKYFSSFDDSKEITSDIESRIAEIFLSKLTDEKQVITEEDVDSLMATMGSIEDFQAAEETFADNEKTENKEQDFFAEEGETFGSKKLYRDEKRKVIGGVSAGIAAYFNIDPMWVRLITLILFIGSYGTLILVYLLMWALIPASQEIKEDRKLKKMFRNPDDKVIAGISSGIATYFGVDSVAIRLLFVAFAFLGGSGIIAYIILWIILPEARSITEKVQMQGEPVTLSNIETNIKKGLNVKEGEEENMIVKILLFPFRLIATIINGVGKALGPLLLFVVDFLRVITGVFMSIFGIVGIFALIVTTGILYGILNDGFLYKWDLFDVQFGHPAALFMESIPSITIIGALALGIIPLIVLILLGVSIIAKRLVFNSTVGWSLFGVFIVSAIVLSINIPAIVYGFHEEARYEETRNYSLDEQTTYLKVDEARGIVDYQIVDLWLKGYDGKDIKLDLEFSSQGATNAEAVENAKKVTYYTEKKDSTLILGSTIEFPQGSKFKFQELDITLYMPYNHAFKMDRTMRDLITYRGMEKYGYNKYQIDDDNIWILNEYGLECVNCDKANEGWGHADRDERGVSRLYDLEDFNSIDVGSAITVRIESGEEYQVEVVSNDRYLKDIELEVIGKKLSIDFKDDSPQSFIRSRDAVVVKITTPTLTDIRLSQASKTYISHFTQDEVRIEMDGAAKAEIDMDVKNLDIELNGSSKLELTGNADDMNIDANGLSQVEGYRFKSKKAIVRANGASSLKLFVTEEIRINRDAVSSVRFRGGAKEIE